MSIINVSSVCDLKKTCKRFFFAPIANLFIVSILYGNEVRFETRIISTLLCLGIIISLWFGLAYIIVAFGLLVIFINILILVEPKLWISESWNSMILTIISFFIGWVVFMALRYIHNTKKNPRLREYHQLIFASRVKKKFRCETNNKLALEVENSRVSFKPRKTNPHMDRAMLIFACSILIYIPIRLLAWQEMPVLTAVVKNLLKAVAGYYGFKCLYLGMRKSAPQAAELRQNDPRPVILLLRSFEDDMTEVDARWRIFSGNKYYNKFTSFEQVITKEAELYGPVIAIGKPNEPLPPLGAARDYISGENWQLSVERLMKEAQKVIVIAGYTEGVQWEVNKLAMLGMLQKTIIVFPPIPLFQARNLNRYRELLRDLPINFSQLTYHIKGAAAIIFTNTNSTLIKAIGQDEWSYEVVIRIAVNHSEN